MGFDFRNKVQNPNKRLVPDKRNHLIDRDRASPRHCHVASSPVPSLFSIMYKFGSIEFQMYKLYETCNKTAHVLHVD